MYYSLAGVSMGNDEEVKRLQASYVAGIEAAAAEQPKASIDVVPCYIVRHPYLRKNRSRRRR